MVVLASAVVAHCLSAQTWSVLSAARLDRSALVAPDSIATGFNASIRAAPPQTAEPPLPLTLAGYSVAVRDSSGAESAAPILSVADGQINFIVPTSAAQGDATFALSSQGRAIASTIVRIARIAPGLFTANASGSGTPAGLALTIAADGSRTTTELFQSATGGGFLPRPLTLSGQVYLVLFGTGIRGSAGELTATIGGKPVSVAAAVAQGTFIGLDQVNLGPINTDFPDRRGELDLILTVDGAPANRVTVAFNPPALGHWGERARLIEANSEMAVAEVDGKILVLGGYPSNRETKSTVQLYDPSGDQWELTTPMPVSLNHNMAATVNEKLYMIGGQLTDAGAGNFSNRVFEYDPSTRQWRERARMPTARGAGVAVVADSKIYVAGGRPPRGQRLCGIRSADRYVALSAGHADRAQSSGRGGVRRQDLHRRRAIRRRIPERANCHRRSFRSRYEFVVDTRIDAEGARRDQWCRGERLPARVRGRREYGGAGRPPSRSRRL